MNPRREHLQQEQEKGSPWIHLHHHQGVQSTRIEGQQIRFGCFRRRRSSQRTSLPHHRWRTRAKRNIIVVSCSQCMDRITPHTDLPTILMATKVQVHMLRDMELSFRGGKRAATVLGFDRTGVFTTKDTSSKTLTGDATLLSQLAVPKETCIPAIMEAEGSFFSLHQLSHGRVRDQKKPASQPSWRLKALSSLFTN